MSEIKGIVRTYYVPHGFRYVEAEMTNDKRVIYGIKAFEAKFGKVSDYPMLYQVENDNHYQDDNDLDFLE